MDLESAATERKDVQISNNEINATYSLGDVAGNFAGSIDSSGRLRAVMTMLSKRNQRLKGSASPLKVNANFGDEKFEAEANGWLDGGGSTTVSKSFRIRLTRVSPPQTGSASGVSTAQPEPQTALLPAPSAPSIVVDKAEVEKDDHLKSVIKKYFNRQTFMSVSHVGGGRRIELISFEDLSVKSISGTTFLVDIKYRAGTGLTGGRIGYATAKIEKTADSYKVISFARK